jgi:predicted ATPase
MSVVMAERALPAGVAPPPPSNLFRPHDAFIGREAELTQLAGLLEPGGPRLVTLLAPGGYGKSRLASETCLRLGGAFAGGVYMLRLARLATAERLPQAVAAAVGFKFSGMRDAGEQLFDYLREKEMLLVFDNVEHVLAGTQFIDQILSAAPGVRLLATSRTPLRLSQERIVELGPLRMTEDGLDAGCQLFRSRATAEPGPAGPEAEACIERICKLLNGVPLGLELAAARTSSMPLSAILAGLEDGWRGLAQAPPPPGWPSSLGAACRWSWNLLPPDQQQALMQLSTFRGGFFAVEAQALLGLPGYAMEELLEVLCASGWLQAYEVDSQPRYSIRNSATREYAWAMMAEGPSALSSPESFYERSRLAHARCFAQLLAVEGQRLKGDPAGRGAGQLAALHRLYLLAEENIHVALDTALEYEALDCLLQI